MLSRVLLPGLLGLLTLCSCSLVPIERFSTGDPDERLELALRTLAQAREVSENNNVNLADEDVVLDVEGAVEEVQRVALDFPNHGPTLVANAIVAYQGGEPEAAERFLDRALKRDPAHARAASLKGRIALEQGNVPFAKRFLEQKVELTPNSSDLRETFAAALLFGGDLAGSLEQLETAERLGAPLERVLFHRGLVALRQAKLDEARTHFRDALSVNPDFLPAQVQMRGLDEGGVPGKASAPIRSDETR